MGIELIDERDKDRLRLDAVEKELKSLKGLHEEFTRFKEIKNEEVLELQVQVKELRKSCQGYLDIRHRFLDTFRRDILKDPTAKWTPMIQAGNAADHHGDAVTDVGLFESSRNDEVLMVKLYGLTYRQVLALSRAGDNDSIAVLNARATLISNKDKPIHEEIEDAWQMFVMILERSLGQLPKENPSSDLGRAYYQFWGAYNRHKQ